MKKMNVPLYMKIRIVLSGIFTLGGLYIAFAVGAKDTREFLPYDQNPLWNVLMIVLFAAALVLLCWGKKEKDTLDQEHDVRNQLLVTGHSAFIRPMPGKEYKYEAIALTHDLLESVETNGWFSILWENKVRWISQNDVDNREISVDHIRVNVEGAHIRTGPNENFDSVMIVHQGDILQRLNTEGWAPVILDHEVYWVSLKEVERRNTAE